MAQRKMKPGGFCSKLGPGGGRPEEIRAISSAISRYRDGKFKDAATLCRRILKGRPDSTDILHLLGLSLSESGRPDEGEIWVRKAIDLLPENPDFQFSLGNILQRQGRLKEALTCFETVIVLKPDHADAHYNLGNLYLAEKNFIMAEACFDRAVRMNPAAVGAWHNRGAALAALGRTAAACNCYEKAITLNPESALSLNSMGTLMIAMGDMDAAKACFSKAVDVDPEYAAAWANLGTVHLAMSRPETAEGCFIKALSIRPELAEVHYNLGNLYQETGDPVAAVNAYETALTLRPAYPEAIAQLYYQARQVCDWSLAQKWEKRIDADINRSLTEGVRPCEMPFINIIRKMDAGLNLSVAKAWSQGAARQALGAGLTFSTQETIRQRKGITVGYLSGDFRNHPVGLLIAGLLAGHDRSRFRVHGYAYGPGDSSDARKKIAAGCDRFVDLGTLSTVESARIIHEDAVDILVDLTGHTRGNRIGICALRPARVQVSYLGFLGSSGADFIDYIFTDALTTPPDQAGFYTEKFVYLPDSFMVTDNLQPISVHRYSRRAVGLPENAFVFCSFNNPYKIDEGVFDCWMRILRQIPGSVLWLLGKSSLASENLKKEAAFRNVSPDRLVFAEKVPLPEHLSRLKQADLALDTWCYNGGATTVNALWAGVPVVTLMGRHFVSRMTASSLSAAGLKELVTVDPETYERLVVRLASHPEALQALRVMLERNRMTEPLFDTPRFTRYVEKAYEVMWDKAIAGEVPGHIVV